MKYTVAAIVVAVGIVGAVAYLVLDANGEGEGVAQTKTATSNSSQVALTPTPSGAARGAELSLDSFVFPVKGASKEAYAAFNKKIYAAAVTAAEVRIKDCAASPLVVKVDSGKEFLLTNQDEIKHTFTNVGRTGTVTVPANSSVRVQMGDVGVYGYSCDTEDDRVVEAGIVAVVK